MKECLVCDQPIPKARVHYGGVSCYSCRAFFRRNAPKANILTCERDGRCWISYSDRKQCAICRYRKCIRIGMQPELVLTANEKKKRFKKFLEKKEKDANVQCKTSFEPQHYKCLSQHEKEQLKSLHPAQPNTESPNPGSHLKSSNLFISPANSSFSQTITSLQLISRTFSLPPSPPPETASKTVKTPNMIFSTALTKKAENPAHLKDTSDTDNVEYTLDDNNFCFSESHQYTEKYFSPLPMPLTKNCSIESLAVDKEKDQKECKNADSISIYVHKKFGPLVFKCEEVLKEDTLPDRNSVIFYASATKNPL